MADTFERLRSVALFDGLDDDDLERICRDVSEVHLESGEVLFHEGEWGDRAYVVTEGDVEILKASQRRQVLLAVRKAGEVIGEMALLQQEPRSATVRARTAVDLLTIPKEALDELLDASPRAARAIFETFLSRLKATNDQLKQSERMAQLGTLTAGVAHELNNPAAAVGRAADRLEDELASFTELVASSASSAHADLVGDAAAPPTDPLARSDLESEVEDWLERHGIDEPWELAADLVDAGIDTATLDGLDTDRSGAELATTLRLAAAATALRRTAREIADGAGRISAIVRALKGYAYLDQAPVQDVDVRRGLEDTLVLLAHKTRHVRVVREFADDLPAITALGTELNQVWTNLIDNACDALQEVDDRVPTLTLRARERDASVVVEVEDNGPGIPPEIQDQIFDAFFTTKAPGEGTGLGLQISYRIVVLEHGGDLTVDSEPGRTTFRVTLPIDQTDLQAATEEDDMPVSICEHLEAPMDGDRPSYDEGCPDCREAGDTWVHLRYCNTCGKVGCCDDSKNRHARQHANGTGHVVVRSLEPGEDWAWCYEHRIGVEL
ncbi:MAG: cyclic nucleotide-binding domain-containing protein [Nitriliruptorales bacterium]|nr:cyclic nucleotide-binding domain-containing protein [Nitriliruptorales bacterium]